MCRILLCTISRDLLTDIFDLVFASSLYVPSEWPRHLSRSLTTLFPPPPPPQDFPNGFWGRVGALRSPGPRLGSVKTLTSCSSQCLIGGSGSRDAGIWRQRASHHGMFINLYVNIGLTDMCFYFLFCFCALFCLDEAVLLHTTLQVSQGEKWSLWDPFHVAS